MVHERAGAGMEASAPLAAQGLHAARVIVAEDDADMTAFGDPATRREAESLGAVMLDKPLQLADLREEVRRLLGRKRSAACTCDDDGV